MAQLHRLVAALLCMATLSIFVVIAYAGREKVAFPAYQNHFLYEVLDQPDVGEIREAYIEPESLKKFHPGQPFPSGTVITMPTFKALTSDDGNFVRDANNRLVRGHLDRIVVMEKRTGWGAEYPDDLRNGEWEYNRFRPDGSYDMTADIKGCFQCHRPFEKVDFVFTIQEIIKLKQR